MASICECTWECVHTPMPIKSQMEVWTAFDLYCAIAGRGTASNRGTIFKVALTLSRSSQLECWMASSACYGTSHLSPGLVCQRQQVDLPNDQHGTVYRL